MVAPRFALFCDDIRQEMNGKFMVLGIYNSEVVVQRFPFAGRLSVFIGLVDFAAEPLEISVEGENGAVFASMRYEAELLDQPEPGDLTYVPVPPIPVNISGPEVITAFIRVADGERQAVGKVRVLQVDPTRPAHAGLSVG